MSLSSIALQQYRGLKQCTFIILQHPWSGNAPSVSSISGLGVSHKMQSKCPFRAHLRWACLLSSSSGCWQDPVPGEPPDRDCSALPLGPLWSSSFPHENRLHLCKQVEPGQDTGLAQQGRGTLLLLLSSGGWRPCQRREVGTGS